jgi:hypothetical protein
MTVEEVEKQLAVLKTNMDDAADTMRQATEHILKMNAAWHQVIQWTEDCESMPLGEAQRRMLIIRSIAKHYYKL